MLELKSACRAHGIPQLKMRLPIASSSDTLRMAHPSQVQKYTNMSIHPPLLPAEAHPAAIRPARPGGEQS
eukprot:6801262-Pyramimonas_sp.AAC.1